MQRKLSAYYIKKIIITCRISPLKVLHLIFCILYSVFMSFKIISVTGAHSSVGKTTLCSILLENLKGFGAIKFTKTHLYTSVIDDPDIIMQTDKDTAVMYRSGAEKVVWVKSSGSNLEDDLGLAMSRMEGLKGVVVEGNSPAYYLNPHLIIFIVGEDGQIKPSAREVSERADIIIVNSPIQIKDTSLITSLSHKNALTFRIDLIKKQGEIDKFIAYIKKYIM
jgi:molybdopterin-guanine dinucleotide biosynthesis protein